MLFEEIVTVSHKIEHRHYLFSQSCSCQSLFTLGACGLSLPGYGIRNMSEKIWNNLIVLFNDVKSGKAVLTGEVLASISRYIPIRYFMDNTTKKWTVRYPMHIYEETKPSGCAVHFYTPAEVKVCTSQFKKLYKTSLKIAFIGDSMIRSIAERMLHFTYNSERMKMFNETFNRQKIAEFLNNKVKHNVPFIGDALEVRFYWYPILLGTKHNGSHITNIITRWSNDSLTGSSKDHPVPHIIYMGGGMWDGTLASDITSTEEVMHSLRKIKPVIRKLSKKVKIFWHVHPFIQVWKNHKSVFPRGALDFMNQYAFMQFRNIPNLWTWDTLALLSVKEFFQCKRFYQANLTLNVPTAWRCIDAQHPGEMPRKEAINIIWNFVCNKILNKKDNYCCS